MHNAGAAYLETQVLTAAPQKLRLMLIDGCIRFARQARDFHTAGNREQFSASLDRARDVVAELISGIRPDGASINETSRALYAFIFKSLAEADLHKDLQKIDDALRVLTEERQTWLAVCELSPELPADEEASMFRQGEVLAGGAGISPSSAATSFSLDA